MNRDLLQSAAAVAGTALLLLPLVALADHRPGHTKTEKNPNLSIGADPNPVLWARAVTVSGKLRGQDNANQRIELQENPHPYPGPFKRVATTTTDANGDYSFREVPAKHTNYRVLAKTAGAPDQVSGEVGVRVKMRINRRVDDRRPEKGDKITFTGKVGPAHDGRRVLLQRRRPSGSWKTVGRARLQDAGPDDRNNSVYTRKKKVTRNSVFRVRIKAHDDHLGNKTRKVRVRVR